MHGVLCEVCDLQCGLTRLFLRFLDMVGFSSQVCVVVIVCLRFVSLGYRLVGNNLNTFFFGPCGFGYTCSFDFIEISSMLLVFN